MQHDHRNEELLDLGLASVETRGALTGMDDEEGGWKVHAGLQDD